MTHFFGISLLRCSFFCNDESRKKLVHKGCYSTEEVVAFILAPGSDSEMSDLENGDDESKKEALQGAENGFDDAELILMFSMMRLFKKSSIKENHSTKMGNQPWQKCLMVNLRPIELRAMKTK